MAFRRARQPKIFAVLSFHNAMPYLPGYFQNVSPHIDGILALDDGSTDGSREFVLKQPKILRVLQREPRHPHVWDEVGNRKLITEAAGQFQPDWLLAVDADERLEQDFRKRAVREIQKAERRGYDTILVLLRELWDGPDQFRSDKFWGEKQRTRLFKWQTHYEHDPRQFHGQWSSLAGKKDPSAKAKLIMYHLKMMKAEDREARRAFWEQLDPDHRWQTRGYSYLTDETGLRLTKLPFRRGYEPLGK